MTPKFSEWLNKAASVDRAIGARVEQAAAGVTGSRRQPLEVVHAVVEAVAAELQPAGRGQMAFPFTQVRVLFVAPTPKDRARLEVASEGPPDLDARIRERVTGSHVTTPPPSVTVGFVMTARPEWTDPDFTLEFTRAAPPPVVSPAVATAAPPVVVPDLVLLVETGIADRPSYTFTGGEVSIGRGSEVRHRDGRLLRTNQVAFIEGASDVNASVSRHHAHIACNATDGSYRLFDDGNGERTSVIRAGQGLRVPHGRGLRLRTGDVIAVGDARLRVEFGAGA